MVQASSVVSADATKLTALVQSSQISGVAVDIDAATAPTAAVCRSYSGSNVESLEVLKAKAESKLAKTRQAEVTANHDFQKLWEVRSRSCSRQPFFG